MDTKLQPLYNTILEGDKDGAEEDDDKVKVGSFTFYAVPSALVKNVIHKLCKKIEPNPNQARYIRTRQDAVFSGDKCHMLSG